MRSRRRRWISLGLILWSSATLLPAAQPSQLDPPPYRYDVVDLGTLGGHESSALGLNVHDQVVGVSSVSTGRQHAFLYQGDTIVDLGVLPGSSSDDSIAYDINDRGWIVGQSGVLPPTKGFLRRDTDLVDVGSLSPHGSTVALSINRGGDFAGASAVNGLEHAFSATGETPDAIRLVDLGLQVPGFSRAFKITDRRIVVGVAGKSNHKTDHRSVVTGPGGLIRWPADLSTPGRPSRSLSANSQGVVVGSAQLDEGWRAARFEEGVPLSLVRYSLASQANDVNDAGQIVGTIGEGADSFAFIYDERHGATDLNRLIHQRGWWLQEAAAINETGHIAGTGIHNGERRAFLLTPEPSLVVALAYEPERDVCNNGAPCRIKLRLVDKQSRRIVSSPSISLSAISTVRLDGPRAGVVATFEAIDAALPFRFVQSLDGGDAGYQLNLDLAGYQPGIYGLTFRTSVGGGIEVVQFRVE